MMGDLQTLYFRKSEITYTGRELAPHTLLSRFGVKGSGIVAFHGPCWVETEHLVDWEDRINRDHITAKMMVHFLGEFFGRTLIEGVLLQRFFMSMVRDALLEAKPGVEIIRNGDDLFFGDRKLSVSIVTATPVSQLLHVGINIDPDGAPVLAVGVKELDLDPEVWVPRVLEKIVDEWKGVQWACVKVRPVV